jgi:hypothetical protein
LGTKKIAANAANEYGKRARERDASKNARQPQNLYLLQGLVLLFESCFGLSAPPEHPNHDGPFVQAVDFVRLRLMERVMDGHDFTDQGTDKLAGRRLRSFTPKAIASLWVREGQRLMARIAEHRLGMSRGSDQSVPSDEPFDHLNLRQPSLFYARVLALSGDIASNPMDTENDRPIDPRSASAYLAEQGFALAEATLAKYRTVGGGPAFLRYGRRILYRRSALNAWLAGRVRELRNTSEAA